MVADGAVDVIVSYDPNGAPSTRVEQATTCALHVPLLPGAMMMGVRLALGHGEPMRAHTADLSKGVSTLWRRGELTLASLEGLVASRVRGDPPVIIADFVAQARERHGLIALSGPHARTLQRAAWRWLGLRPKTLLRIERARAALRALACDEPLAEVAFALGFTDQPHLTRELRLFAGQTPDACRKSPRHVAQAEAR